MDIGNDDWPLAPLIAIRNRIERLDEEIREAKVTLRRSQEITEVAELEIKQKERDRSDCLKAIQQIEAACEAHP